MCLNFYPIKSMWNKWMFSTGNNTGTGKSNDPVDTYSGELFFHEPADLSLGGVLRLAFGRYYASYLSANAVTGELGDNWRHNFEWEIHWVANTIRMVTPTGKVMA